MQQDVRRWERLEQLFAAAIDAPSDRVSALLAQEAANDPELADELRSLLEHDAGAKERIAHAIVSAASPLEWIGRRAGPYRIVREIGRGGMGQVFEAVRDDDEYQKTVALKIATGWRDRDIIRQRFRQERQILSGLEHPNIARFLDGGTHDGVPYFAMEFVEGRPITAYAAALSLREKIELFRVVCAAVQYAHQHLVVHRDLKPGNILVTADGVPKLLDFGIAKLVTPLEEDGASTRAPVWTPDYASPEQVRSQSVTTRTDVYSLGLILFELLTGTRAQTADQSSPRALDRSICETETVPASECARARGDLTLARELRGDLDAIVATAIRKEPDRRYISAAALSDDLSRYLNGFPVEARHGAVAYRAGKIFRRHFVAFAAGALILAAIGGGGLVSLYQARRAERRFQQVRHLSDSVLFGLQDRLQNLAGATETREWAVRTALDYLDDLAQDAGGDSSMLTELAAGYIKIGDVQGYPLLPNLGHREAALASYRRAQALATQAAAATRGREARRVLAQSHQRIGAILRAFVQTNPAIAEYKLAMAEAEPLYAEDPNDESLTKLLSSVLLALGQAYSASGNLAEASRLWLRSAQIKERIASAKGATQAAELARTEKPVIRALMYSGDLDASERIARDGLRVRESLAAAQPANAAVRRDLGNAYADLGYLYYHSAYLNFGERDTAAVLHRKSLAIARELAAADPSNAAAQSDLNISEIDLADDIAESDPAQAASLCREGLAITTRWNLLNAEGYAGLAHALLRMGRVSEALDAARNALDARSSLHKRDPGHFVIRQQLLRGRGQMAAILSASGDRDGARAEHEQAVAVAEALAAEAPTNLLARRDLADAYEAYGAFVEKTDRAQAAAWYRKSLDLWTAWPTFAHTSRMDRERRARAQQLVARART